MSMLSVFTLNTHFMSYGKLPSFIFASVNKGLHDSIACDNAHDKIYIYIYTVKALTSLTTFLGCLSCIGMIIIRGMLQNNLFYRFS